MPYESLLLAWLRRVSIPESRGIWLCLLLGVSDATSELSSIWLPMLLPGRRMLLRMVTEVGKSSSSVGPVFGVLFLGAGNLDLADCTRSSIFCILPRRFRIWYNESDRGSLSLPGLLGLEAIRGLDDGGFIALASDAAALLDAVEGPLVWFGWVRGPCKDGRGVRPESGINDLRFGRFGVRVSTTVFVGASDSGGEGGVCISEAVSDFDGGVDAIVEGVMPLASLPGLLARRLSTAKGLGFRDRSLSIISSASRSFSSVISFSTFRSDRSSLSLCASIRNASRSCSPCLNSSSINTPRSIATLYLLSKSSKLDSVCLACRS